MTISLTTRVVYRRRVWTLEAGRWRFSLRFGRYRPGVVRDSLPGRPFAGSVSLPFACLTAFRRSF